MTYLDFIDKVKEHFESEVLIERVQNEDLDDFDLDKSTVYPLALFYVENVNIGTPTNTFILQLMVLDILDINKESGENNENFIWNQSLAIVNNFVSRLRRGDLFSDLVQVSDEVIAEKISDRFDKGLAGIGATINIEVPNQMTIC